MDYIQVLSKKVEGKIVNYDFEEFQKSISRELLTIKDRVRNLISDAHWGEEGRYKESVLKNVIKRFLPSNLSLASGFIITKEGENIKRSRQIDIIVYENTSPLLFVEGDFIITTPENVLATIEVKTKIRSGNISDVINKASENARLAHRSTFNGIFAYEKSGMDIKRGSSINPNLRDALIESKGAVNHICLDENLFIKYWGSREKYDYFDDKIYSFYDIEELSFAYFISNLIECVAPDKVVDKSWFLYPLTKPNGKEDSWIKDISLPTA